MTANFSKILGVNTVDPRDSLKGEEGGRWLADAVNVDVLDDNSLQSRPGLSIVENISGAHSIYDQFIVRNGVLYEHTIPDYTETFVRVLQTNADMVYCKTDSGLFMTNGLDGLMVGKTGLTTKWAFDTPGLPGVSLIEGALPAGIYSVGVAYADGEHFGGISQLSQIELVDTSGIRVTLPPQIEGATHVHVYVTGVSGSAPMLYSKTDIGQAYEDVVALPELGSPGVTVEKPLPPGHRLFEFNGRLCSVSGKCLFVGIPYKHGYYDPLNGEYLFTEEIAVANPVDLGIYVSTRSQTWFIPAQLLESSFEIDNQSVGERVTSTFPFGGVRGSEFVHPYDNTVGWFSPKGFVLATNTGEAKLVAENFVPNNPSEIGKSFVLKRGNTFVIVSSGCAMNIKNFACTRYSGWEVNSHTGDLFVTSEGIYKEDINEPVQCSIDLGDESFGSYAEKSLPTVYVRAKSDQPVELEVSTMNGGTFKYYARTCSEEINVHRIEPGKGLRDNLFGLKLSAEGSPFRLTGVSFINKDSTRRI